METRTFVIEGHQRDLDKIEAALRYAAQLTNLGGSRTISLFVDGDGQCKLKATLGDGSPLQRVHSDEVALSEETTTLGQMDSGGDLDFHLFG